MEPDIDDGDAEQNCTGDRELASLRWENVDELTTDPRASTGSMPEDITPAFNMANYRDENYLNWFLHYFPLAVVTFIVASTNKQAKKVSWPLGMPWGHLKTGEFLRWLGIWILMTVYPTPGSCRRNYWRGILNFGQFMSEKRFEAILRAFTLPQYDRSDRKWGGPGRVEHERKRFDPFYETRRFCDLLRERFQSAMKPGGWLCIDESMFSWLGRAIKLPGWKIIKRKPRPIGLESKTTACSVTGMLIDFEFQEGRDIMDHFEFVSQHNKSTAWLLRLTKYWHNKEKRTVVADAAFAQVRAAVSLYKVGGLYLIGNVKTCNKFFPQKALREETDEYERDTLVCLTKKAEIRVNPQEKLQIFATGWRCTGAMVCTYVHTGGTNITGSDRKKRRYTQLSDGNLRIVDYSVKRPKVSAEYQQRMGAIDGHNFRRQSGRSTEPLEKACVTRNTKDRIFISVVSWILVNIFLAKKHFVWGGADMQSSAEVQEAIAKALIHNQWLEDPHEDEPSTSTDVTQNNSLDDCVPHPLYKQNVCRVCFKGRTIYTCRKCSKPKQARPRKDKGKLGAEKLTHGGYMHFCKHAGCFQIHACGKVPRRRPKDQVREDNSVGV